MSALGGSDIRRIAGPQELISEILDDLYAGALDEDAWGRAMVRVSDLAGASGVNLIAVNLETGRVLRDESHRLDPSVATAYREYWSAKDILVGPLLRVPVGEPTPDYKLASLEAWEGCELFNELALPMDLPYILPTLLHKSDAKIVALSLKTSKRHGPFHEYEADLLRVVIPHIRRALEIRDRLAVAQMRSDTLVRSLDCLSFGVLILDATGRIIECNAMAEELMRADSGVHRHSDGRLFLREPAGAVLHRWLLSGTPPSGNLDGLLKLPRKNVQQPLSILVTPLPHKTTCWIAGDPRWMLLLFDPERRLSISAELISRDLGISLREAQVAALLVAGYDPTRIAHRLGISANTARTHVKAIFSKTGIHSQTELIRRIASGPGSVDLAGRPHS